MKYLKAFISGLIFPSIIIPFGLLIAVLAGKFQLLHLLTVHFLPIIWGIWNILYFAGFKNILPKERNTRLFIHGALLGLLVAIYGIFWLHIPSIIGLIGASQYFPLIGGPILYALLWRYVVGPLNELLGLKD